MTDHLESSHWTGQDDRDSLTQPEPDRCLSCGAIDGSPCETDCGCARCRSKELQPDASDVADGEPVTT